MKNKITGFVFWVIWWFQIVVFIQAIRTNIP